MAMHSEPYINKCDTLNIKKIILSVDKPTLHQGLMMVMSNVYLHLVLKQNDKEAGINKAQDHIVAFQKIITDKYQKRTKLFVSAESGEEAKAFIAAVKNKLDKQKPTNDGTTFQNHDKG